MLLRDLTYLDHPVIVLRNREYVSRITRSGRGVACISGVLLPRNI